MSLSVFDNTTVALVVNEMTAARRPSAVRPAQLPSRRAAPAAVLELVVGDITCDIADAIVNPAGGGLVDLAVRRAGGLFMLEELHRNLFDTGAKLGPGQAILTGGHGLAAPHVIHCGPPVYADGPGPARQALVACHVEALRLARARGLMSIAFPAIGTGMYRYPVREAAEVSVRAVVSELRANPGPGVVRFVFSDEALLRLYASAACAAIGEDPARDERGLAFTL